MPSRSPANVVVISDAGSALGQTLALEFAVKHDATVLAAAPSEDIDATRRGCEMLGAWSMVTPLSADAQSYRKLVRVSLERFRRIDIWVNHASSTDDSSANSARRLAMLEAGARAALEVFVAQGHGVLVNVDLGTDATEIEAVRALFAKFAAETASLPQVTVHNIFAQPGSAIDAISAKIVRIARASARGRMTLMAGALATVEDFRVRRRRQRARRRLASSPLDAGALMAVQRDSGQEHPGRRGGWHLAHTTDERDRTIALMALIGLPLVMAGVMLALVRF